MHLIVYTSKSMIDSSDIEAELHQIVTSSKRNNANNGLTGAMFQHRCRFLQFLEGEQTAVVETFERIKNDPRHTEIEVLFDSPIRQRGCPDWSMDVFEIPHDVDMSNEHLKMLSDSYCRNFIVQTDTILSLFKGFMSESTNLNAM